MKPPLPLTTFLFFLLLLASLPAQHFLIEHHANQLLKTSIAEATQAGNVTATRLFVNEVYPRLAQRLNLEKQLAPIQGLSGEDLAETDRTIRKFVLGTDILKVKIFAMNGITIYSSETSQIGQDQSRNPALISASQGIPRSQIEHRERFSALDGGESIRDLVSSYIPLRSGSGAVIGVAEIYTDRTPVINQILGGDGRLHPYLFLCGVVQMLLLIFLGWSFYSQFQTWRAGLPQDVADE
jgi:hypothetical protein